MKNSFFDIEQLENVTTFKQCFDAVYSVFLYTGRQNELFKKGKLNRTLVMLRIAENWCKLNKAFLYNRFVDLQDVYKGIDLHKPENVLNDFEDRAFHTVEYYLAMIALDIFYLGSFQNITIPEKFILEVFNDKQFNRNVFNLIPDKIDVLALDGVRVLFERFEDDSQLLSVQLGTVLTVFAQLHRRRLNTLKTFIKFMVTILIAEVHSYEKES